MYERLRRLGVDVLAFLTGAVFIYAGVVKLRAAGDFSENITGYRLLPHALVNLLAISLPPFELMLGCLLVLGWRRRTAAFCTLLLTGVFLLALVSADIRGIPINCGCFGEARAGATPGHLLWMSVGRDLLLMGAAVVVYLDGWKQSGGGPSASPVDPAQPPGAASGIAQTKPPLHQRTDR